MKIEETTYMESLFPEKEDFNPDSFEQEVLDETFKNCIRNGVLQGFHQTEQRFSDKRNSFNAMSHCRHEDIFWYIRANLLANYDEKDFYFTEILAGNNRLYFIYKDYTFILRPENGSSNRTKQEQDIQEQNLEHHVITITFSLNQLRTGMGAVALQYIQGKNIKWQMRLPLESISLPNYVEVEDNNSEIIATKPKLKASALKLKKNA